jgi:hypothetical protein
VTNKTAMGSYSLNYCGYTIVVKRDFGDKFYMLDGMPCNFGYNVTKDQKNPIPGAGWFQTVADAKTGIDCLIASAGDAQRFHALYKRAKSMHRVAPELWVSLEKIKEKLSWVRAQDAARVAPS